MKKLVIITVFLISNFSFSQLKAVVIDKGTKEGIPFVNIWVAGENSGTTSNEKGEFNLHVNHSKIIIFSAIGFETRRIAFELVKERVELKPMITELDEVVITSKKQLKSAVIGKFKKSRINHYFACGTTPWISARHYEYKEGYKETPFLEKIKIVTKSKIRDAKFNIRLYRVNENGAPGNYLYGKNIIGIAKKGKKRTEIDVSELNIEFPKTGFFIAFEWLIIEDNKYEFNYTINGAKKKHKGIRYAPRIGLVPVEADTNSWIFIQGNWRKAWKNNNDNSKRYKGKYNLLAIELTLIN